MSVLKYERGAVLLLTLVICAALLTVTTAFFSYFGSAVSAQQQAVALTQARLLAEAGVDEAVYSLNQNASYSGETGTALGNGVFDVSVTSINSNTKRVAVTSYVPDKTSPLATKTVDVSVAINTSVVAFRYGVQIGKGGVVMHNGATIEGNIFANGSISGSGTVTGDATVAMSASTTPDQQSVAQDSGFPVADTSGHAVVAQSFVPSTSASLARVSLDMAKIGNPGDLAVKIVTDYNGKPSTTVLASGTLPASLLTTSYGFADATLDSAPTLYAGHTYWIVVSASVDPDNYATWGLDTSGGYASGIARYGSALAKNTAWSTITGDLGFKAYLNGQATSLDGVNVQGNAWAYSLSNCSVGGNASYQTILNCSVSGTQNPGATIETPGTFPISDAQIAQWEATAAAGGTISGPYSISGAQTMGPVKIDGDLSFTNGSALILSGPVWVNGNITVANNASIEVSPSTGSSGAILIADETGNTDTGGVVNLSNNMSVSGNGNTGSVPMVISTNTSNDAISLSNNAASIILYAPYGGVLVSNGASANQITANRLELENNASVNYLSGLQSASFSNGPGGSWAVVPGTYVLR